MRLEDCILKGKENKRTREQLMYVTNLDRDNFKRELAKIKRTKIVLFDNGYYKPNTLEDYKLFEEKCLKEISNLKLKKEDKDENK